MARRPFGTKPLSKPMLGYCQLDPMDQTSVKFWSKYKSFHFGKSTWKHRLRNGSHFDQGEMGYTILSHLLSIFFFPFQHQYNGVCLLGARALWETAPSPSTTTHALLVQDVSIQCAIILIYTGLFPVTYASVLAIAHTTSLCRNNVSDVYESTNNGR